jgi:hypothetical protein
MKGREPSSSLHSKEFDARTIATVDPLTTAFLLVENVKADEPAWAGKCGGSDPARCQNVSGALHHPLSWPLLTPATSIQAEMPRGKDTTRRPSASRS